MSLRHRTPRERDPAYMGWVAQLPCAACLVRGTFKRGVHVAHLRTGSLEHGKRDTGGAEKPDDRWTLPLCPPHHTGDARRVSISQHAMNELEFWAAHGINPFTLCIDLRTAYAADLPGTPVISKAAARGRRIIEGAP